MGGRQWLGEGVLIEVFERFTDRARRVVVLAQEEARMLNHTYIGTEHLLLGLVHEGEGVAARALESLGISLGAVRQQVEEIIGQGQQALGGHFPFTPRAKKVVGLARREASDLGRMNPILAHYRQPLSAGSHTFGLRWRVPHRRSGAGLYLVFAWSSHQPPTRITWRRCRC